ncbi:hypothetical protein EU537_05425 [Candidatus Thorarchaeota archaeon]|nr:MAG: hypothetical protein EU537_05425 [Candidatus Thorarchaeota archaeon]
MNRRAAAIVIIIVIGVAAVSYILLMQGHISPPVELVDEKSSSYQDVLINEVRPGTESTNAYVELYTSTGHDDMEDWIVTTYDEDRIILPVFGGNSESLFILISWSEGIDDLDASDGQVTIHTDEAEILDSSGDEVGLHDSEGRLVSFMRYGGGNGDEVLGDWTDSELGIDIPSSEEDSISLMGNENDYSESWISTMATPGEPNVEILTTTGTYGGEEVFIYNGIRIVPEPDGLVRPENDRGENVTITPGPGVNASVVALVKEHINFSLNFFREHNFTDPATATGNEIKIRLVRSGSSESTGSSNSNGEIVIRVGRDATKEELKVVGEHELLHLFQFKRRTDSSGGAYYPLHEPDYWWDEGMAEFWAVYSMLRNYPNMTMTEWNEMAHRLGSLSWLDHFRDINGTGAFHDWDHSWDSYMAAFLFVKFINESFGTETLLEVFNRTKYYGRGDPRNVDPKDAFAKALNMTWSEIYSLFLSWLLLDSHQANGVPVYTPHIRLNYTGGSLNDTVGVQGGGGAVIEEIEVSNTTSFRIQLNHSGASQNWTVIVLIFYEDGTNGSIPVQLNDTTMSGEIFIDPSTEKQISRIWVVKSVTEGPIDGRITMRIIPSIEMTYNNDTIGDTVLLNSGESVYEVIEVNSTQAFSVFLNWSDGYSHWNITVLRFWSDGTNDSYSTEIVNGTWPGYTVDPDAGPTTITKLIFIKENLNETSVPITMRVTPTTESPTNANEPIEPGNTYHWEPNPWDPFGGLLEGYIYIESGIAFDFISETLHNGEFSGMVLSSNLTVMEEFLVTPSSPVLQLRGYDTGLYYFVLHSGPSTGFDWTEIKPYDWP